VIGRAFGLARTSVGRVLSRGADERGGHEPQPDPHMACAAAAGPRQAQQRELAQAGRVAGRSRAGTRRLDDPGPARAGRLAGLGADQARGTS
jgi:hypothetical protein